MDRHAWWTRLRRVGGVVLSGLAAMGYVNGPAPPWQWAQPGGALPGQEPAGTALSAEERSRWTELERALRLSGKQRGYPTD